MKVNLLAIIFLTIFAVSRFELLSAADVPQSDEKKSEESSAILKNASTADYESGSTENASVESLTMPYSKIEIPIEFPVDKIYSQNDTALKILQSISSSSSKSIEDPKSIETSSEAILSMDVTTTSTTSIPTSTEKNSSNITATEEDYDDLSEEEKEKSDTENIQENDEKTQDELEEEFAKTGSDKASINIGEDPVLNTPVLHSGHIALIFASSLVILSVVAYVGLILWRSRLEQRYGNRQRLVTDDTFYNNNDVRYFGL